MSPSSISPPQTQSMEEEEEGLTQECKDLLPSLPKDKFWFVTDLYQYKGYWYETIQISGILACQKHFIAQDTDLLLVTTPKSGTTWLKAFSFAIINRMRYSQNDHPLLKSNPHDLVPFLETELYNDIYLVSPRLFSTHLPLVHLPESIKTSKCKIVYLCRDPKDTFISFWHFTNKIRPNDVEPISLQEGFEKFCVGLSLYGPFWDHVLGYWKESLERPDNVFFLKYEAIKKDPKMHLRRLAEFLGYPFSLEEEKNGVVDEILKLCSFESLSNLEVNKIGKSSIGIECNAYFRRGEVGDSKNYLTLAMIQHIDRITEQKLHGSGLEL